MNRLISTCKAAMLVALLTGAGTAMSLACTSLVVGKSASADGSTIISYAADSHVRYGYLQHFPAADHKAGDVRRITGWSSKVFHGYIPEVAHTYSVVGCVNEHQLTITESTWGGRKELVDKSPEAILDYGSLMIIALQRSKTAREAIAVMADLTSKYGYNSSGESISIGDPNEVWVLEIIGKGGKEKGAVWVAVRIPDDCISGHANYARIHQFDLHDPANCLYSPDVISFARKMGYFSGKDEDFDFSKAYNPVNFGLIAHCDRRVWSWFNRFATGMDRYLPYINCDTDAEVLPLYVRPDKKVSVADVQNMMRDHYEGTPFDMTKDPGARIWYDSPYRWRPASYEVDSVEYSHERAIATQQTGFVLVSQMRSWLPDCVGCVQWFGVDDANTAVFVPMYCCMTEAPASYAEGTADLYNFSTESAFWMNNWVANQAYTRYSYMIGDIRKVQGEIEKSFADNQPQVERTAVEKYGIAPADAVAYLTQYSVDAAQATTKRYCDLAQYLLVKFLDGNIKKEENGKFKRSATGLPVSPVYGGYTEEYYKAIVRDKAAAERLRNR